MRADPGHLQTLETFTTIAAEYYNGTLWPKFRFWEWVAHLPRGGERRARNEVLRHLPDLSWTRLLVDQQQPIATLGKLVRER